MVGHFEETGHPVLKGTGVLSGGILKRQDGRCTIHFNGDSSNTDRLFAQFTQQSSSVSTEQFQAGVKSSIVEKFAAKENDQLLKDVCSRKK